MFGSDPTTSLPVPADQHAEESLAVIVAESDRGAGLAIEHGVRPEMFHLPSARRVFAAVVTRREDLLAAEAAAAPGWRLAARLDLAGQLAAVDRATLRRWAEECPVALDALGVIAQRVRDAARRRQAMSVAADLYRAAAVGDDQAFAEAGAQLAQVVGTP